MFLTPHIIVKKTPNRGKGVFATAEIEPGTVIGDYLGIVTKTDEGLEYEHDTVYDMWYSSKADICPDPKEEGVHLLNASCEPNCAMAGLGRRTLIFALRKIFPGEELTYDYFLGDQDEECEPGTNNCRCGSPFCRGTMHSNPMAYEAWDAYITRLVENLPEDPPVPYGERLPPLKEYPTTINDDPIYPMWGTRTQPPLSCKKSIFRDPQAIRRKIRSSGRALSFPELGVMIEGIMEGGHMAVHHLPSPS